MINITRQKIGIYCKDREWGRQCFNKVLSQIPEEMISKVINSKSECACYLINGDMIRVVPASDNSRGCKFTGAIIQDGVDRRIIEEIIYPCVKYPVAILKNAEDVTASYVAIKQELPQRNKKFVKIRVRY